MSLRRGWFPRVPVLAIAALALLCAQVAPALALPRRTAIALVSGGATAELSARLRAELSALGWRVVELQAEPGLALAQLARRAQTLAVLRVGVRAEGIEVWVAPEVDAEASSEWIDVEVARSEVAVLRAVEALRAHFVKLGIEPEDAQGSPVAHGARRPAPIAAEPPSLWFGAHVALGASSGGVPPLGYVGVSVRWAPLRFAALASELWGPPSGGTLIGEEGQSSVRPFFATALLEPQLSLRGVRLSSGVGAALMLMDTRGEAAPGYSGRHDSLLTGLALARAGARFDVSRSLRIGGDLSLGISAPRAVVRFDERQVATFGRPLFLGALGAEWAPFAR